MLSDVILNALNDQIAREKFAATTYEQMSCWFANQGLHGFREYLEHEAKEECCHAHKIMEYILHRNSEVKLLAVEAPANAWQSPQDVFAAILELEQSVTGFITSIMTFAITDGDFATQSMLQWFIDNQVKEENDAFRILQKLQMIGDDKAALLALDGEICEKGKKPDMTIAGFDLNDI